ncbi:prostaglandin F2-alpha receptor [Alosa pseudoharengus]|uniref:prostaglandin F2-alpha receptor n=1 Tax=Alosa pseudoharengus TaxID=34774 RepID=UPI003F8B527A
MTQNRSSEARCLSGSGPSNGTRSQAEVSVISSVISMSVGILSNTLALFILIKAYQRFRLKSKACFLLFASGLVVTDCLGHLINGSLVFYVYSYRKDWEAFDPKRILCGIFGTSMVFFGLSPLLLGGVMAVERYLGVTHPFFHSSVIASCHMKTLMGAIWLLALFVALLPILLCRPYEVQCSRSWCFFRMVGARDWLDTVSPVLFSLLGLLSLLVSIVCNAMSGFALLQSKQRSHRDRHHCHHRKSSAHHLEMICQLLAIMIVSCVCWGPFLVNVIVLNINDEDQRAYTRMLLTVRMATWNQILDPWVYILLRKAVLRKLFLVTHRCCGSRSQRLYTWRCGTLTRSVEVSTSVISRPECRSPDGGAIPESNAQFVVQPGNRT